MNLISIQGDDNIQKLCHAAMKATLIALNNEGRISADEVDKFLNNHIAVFMTHDGGWANWLKRKFGKEPQNVVVVCKTYTHVD
jgi:transcriptional regulatory protein LevR